MKSKKISNDQELIQSDHLTLTGQAVSEEKMFKECGRRAMMADGQRSLP